MEQEPRDRAWYTTKSGQLPATSLSSFNPYKSKLNFVDEKIIPKNGGSPVIEKYPISIPPVAPGWALVLGLVLDPQHGGGHIPNGAPGTTRVGGNDHQAAAGMAPLLA